MKSTRPLLTAASIAIGLSLASASAHATSPLEPSWRLSADLSWGKVDHPCPALGRCSPVELSGRLRLAYAISPRWALELSTLSVDSEVGLVAATTKVSGAGAALVVALPIAETWSVLGRAGVASLRSSHRPDPLRADSTQARKTGPWFGGGLRWQLSPRWHVEAHADWARAGMRLAPAAAVSTHTVRWVGLGAGVSF